MIERLTNFRKLEELSLPKSVSGTVQTFTTRLVLGFCTIKLLRTARFSMDPRRVSMMIAMSSGLQNIHLSLIVYLLLTHPMITSAM